MSREQTRPTAYFVPHTHWDREWYLPFETFRVRLVDVIDRLLDMMKDDPEYRVFTLDGQTIILNDYLEVRPDREPLLRSLVEQKRIRIGPWYVLADEFLVSPESLIRNLAAGSRACESFGDRLEVLYTPDSFGHISQLPLLAQEFGLDTIVFERGVGNEGERLRGEFTWRSADGASEAFTHHLVTTYSSAAGIGHADWELSDAYDPDRAARHASAALFGADGVNLDYMPDWFRASLERVPKGAAAYATGDALLLMNGSDHLYAQANLPQLIRDLNLRIPEVEFVHADLEAFIRHARASVGTLETHQGEFRGSRYQHILSGVLSARMYLKQANDAAQTRLEKYTEPLAALAWLRGRPYPRALLHCAWEKLLENHPHDSICGCSVDAVHDAMMARFDAVRHIADPLERAAEAALTDVAGSEAISVFNPHPFPVTRVVQASLTLPSVPSGPIELIGADGRAAPSTIEVEEVYPDGRSDKRVGRARIVLQADLPALGFASYRIQEVAQPPEARRGEPQQEPSRQPGVHADDTGMTVMLENDTLRLEVDRGGQVTLLHKPSGREEPLHLRFEDDGDAGDSYDFSPVKEPTIMIQSPSAAPKLVERSPLRSTVRLEYRAEIPARLSADRNTREGSVALPLTLDLTLEANRPSVGLRVETDNRAEDHRLRLRVATGRNVDEVLAEGHFDIVRRPVTMVAGTDWFQAPQSTNHQRRFVAVHDGDSGLAILNRGLPEYEASLTKDGVDLAVTLLRCVGWLSRDDLTSRPQGAGPSLSTPGAQCPGRHVFELALLPLAGAEPHADLLREADLFMAPPRARATSGPASDSVESLLELSAPLVMTALKVADTRDSLLVRIWNPSFREVEGILALGFSPAAAYAVRFDETRLRPLDLDESTVHVMVPSQGVRTIELTNIQRG